MKSGSPTKLEDTHVEIAIVAKWTLHEAWLSCMEILDQRYKNQQLSFHEKLKLQGMYTSFFSQVFYSGIKTRSDFDELIKNSKKMLSLLKELDPVAWSRLMAV